MVRKKVSLLIVIFVICSSFLFQVSTFYSWGINYNNHTLLGLSGDRATVEWVRVYDDPEPYNWDQAYDVEIDPFGNVYCVGYSLSSQILVKYNSKGDYILNRTWYPGSGYAEGKAVALDSSNNIYVAGQVNLRGDYFLVKYDSDCVFQWVRTWGGSQEDPLWDMAIDSNDNIYLAGATESYSVGESDMCVVKYNSSGDFQWYRTWGGYYFDTAFHIAIDASDDIILGGHTSDYSGSYTNIVLVKFNSSGDLQWDLEWDRGYGHYEFNDGVVIDSNGNIFTGVESLNTHIPTIVKFDSFGNEIWNRTYPGLDFYYINEMEIDSYDNLYLATTFDYRDYGFAKINKFGDFLWSETWGTADDEFCTGMALNGSEHVYLTGYRSFHSYGPMVTVKFKITPPDPPIFTDIQEDFMMYEGDNSKTLIWTPVDESNFYDSYWVMRNDTKIMEGAWDGSQVIYSDLGSEAPGIYNYTCFVNNTYGKLNSSSILVTILPNLHAPYIESITTDASLNIGTINFIVSWHAFDLDGNNNSYRIERNAAIIDSGMWNNDSDIVFIETELLSVGLYNYTCFVNDTSGMENQASIYITIINHDPMIYNNTVDFTVNEGTTGYSLSWHVIDIDGNTLLYWIERNGVQLVQNSWVNDSDIVYIETQSLSAGTYNYTCFVNDSTGAFNQSSLFVKLNSYAYFSDITLPSNNIYEQDADYVFNCTWLDMDGTIESVLFEFGSANYTVTANVSGIFTFTLNDLSANENGYGFRWHAKDSDGAWTSTGWQNFILNKKVIDLIMLFNGTENNYFYEYNPLVNITIINQNSTSGTINLFIDGDLEQQETGYVLINISQYSLGSYNITAVLTDENYTGSIMKWLHLSELVPPEIIFEFSEFYVSLMEPEYSDDEIELICIVNDFSLLSWVYCCDNSSGSFSNNTMFSLGNGNWTYTIDISGLDWGDSISILFFARDFWGNIGSNDNSTNLYQITIHDFQNPTTSLSFTPYEGTDKVIISTLLSLVSDDGLGSGISSVRYKINDSGWMDYSVPFNLDGYAYGYYNISYYSIDHAGNVEEIKSKLIELVEIPEEPTEKKPTVTGFNILLVFGIIAVITTIKVRKRIRS